MTQLSERSLGFGFGLIGGLLLVLSGLVVLAVGAADLVGGYAFRAIDAGSEAFLLEVFGGLALLFAYLGHRPWADRPVTSGALLLVVALVAWGAAAFDGGVFALVGVAFVLLAGVLYLIPPARATVTRVLPA